MCVPTTCAHKKRVRTRRVRGERDIRYRLGFADIGRFVQACRAPKWVFVVLGGRGSRRAENRLSAPARQEPRPPTIVQLRLARRVSPWVFVVLGGRGSRRAENRLSAPARQEPRPPTIVQLRLARRVSPWVFVILGGRGSRRTEPGSRGPGALRLTRRVRHVLQRQADNAARGRGHQPSLRQDWLRRLPRWVGLDRIAEHAIAAPLRLPTSPPPRRRPWPPAGRPAGSGTVCRGASPARPGPAGCEPLRGG